MPQLRKRKTKEIISEEVEKKVKKENPVTSKNAVKRKKKNESLPRTKTKVKSSTKRKISDSAVCSDKKSFETQKTSVKNSLRKDPKLGKEVVSCINIKDESSDSEYLPNSVDSGISSGTSPEIIKEETKLNTPEKSKPSTSFSNDNKYNDSSSSESEWEEVDDGCETNSLDDYKPNIPKEGVEITIDCPDLRIRKRKKKEFDENEWIRLHINRIRKDIQLSIHKTHLLCLLAHGIYINKILNCDSLKALALSLIPDDISSYTSGRKVDKLDINGIGKIVDWFRERFHFENEKCLFLNFFSSITKSFENQKAMNASEYNLMFIVIARSLGFKVRLCVSLYPITYKATNLIKKPTSKKNESETNEKQKKVKLKKDSTVSKVKKQKRENNSGKAKKKISEEKSEKISRPRRSTKQSYTVSSDEDDVKSKYFELSGSDSDDDFQITRKSTSKTVINIKNEKIESPTVGKSNRKILSSDSEPSSPQSSSLKTEDVICWAEIFSKPDKQWIAIECSHNIINKPYDIEVLLPKPVSYILTYDNNSYVKDVTRRYCNEYMTTTIKLRVDSEWWEETLDPFLPPNSQLDKAEEKKLDEMLVNKPLPSTIQGFKNHPLYALKRHLLKFEAIYPPDAPPVGFVRSEPVYARDCVHQLHSRETWLKEARVVRIGEQPYKIVKARPKWDRIAGVMKTDLPLEIFGHWQTEQYEPPVAVNGKVPRNEYGNVELFKSCMLPKGTVHLQLPGLHRIAKKLGIDCCPAVVGFDGHKGSVHPVFDGFIVCKEFKDTLIAAWDEEQENTRKREEEKREKRIYGNWKKLIKGLLIRERIKLKYDTK